MNYISLDESLEIFRSLFVDLKKQEGGKCKRRREKGISFDSVVYELWEDVFTISVLDPKNYFKQTGSAKGGTKDFSFLSLQIFCSILDILSDQNFMCHTDCK